MGPGQEAAGRSSGASKDRINDDPGEARSVGRENNSLNPKQISTLVQASKEQSSQLGKLSRNIEKEFSSMQSSLNQLEERIQNLEKKSSVVVDWVNRKNAKKAQKAKRKKKGKK